MGFLRWLMYGNDATSMERKREIDTGQRPASAAARFLGRHEDAAAARKASRQANRRSGDFFGDGRDFWGRKK